MSQPDTVREKLKRDFNEDQGAVKAWVDSMPCNYTRVELEGQAYDAVCGLAEELDTTPEMIVCWATYRLVVKGDLK